LGRVAATAGDFEECGIGERFYVVNSYHLSLLHIYCMLEFIEIQQQNSSIVCVQTWRAFQDV